MTATSELAALCATTSARLTEPSLADRVRAVARQLDAPLEIAVAGAVSSGKSTMVNALLGIRIAAVDAGECTRIVTRYGYSADHGSVEVQPRRGRVRALRLDGDGRLPRELGLPAEEIRAVRVGLDLPLLRNLTIVDTPGIDTVAVDNEAAARRMVFGTDGAGRAQALVYVLRQLRRFDSDTLAEFRALSATCGLSGANTLVVLSQIDRRGDAGDPWPVARRLAANAQDRIRLSAYDVVPVVGLIAETALTRALSGADLAALGELARLDPLDLDDALLDLTTFRDTADLPVTVETRRRLVDRLHRYGLLVAVRLLRARPTAGLDDLYRELLAHSGFGAMTGDAGIGHFLHHAEHLKCFAALADLRRISRLPCTAADRPALDTLATAVDAHHPGSPLHQLRIFAAVDAAARGALPLDDDLTTALLRLARHDDPARRLGLDPGTAPAGIAAAARAAAACWRTRMSLAGPVGGTAHRAVQDVLALLEELAREAPSPVAVDPATVEPVLDSPALPAEHRKALADLLAGATAAAQVGAAANAPAAEVTRRAGALAARFRALLHGRPLPTAERRAVTVARDAYETIGTAP
ncbi:dynamin family protein [Actinoplanes regularis]|uniref:Dynamin family protein n=1 Tax=Actinoplanes regularis TaxID=52697 RepID=A0A239JRR0_9ACTN|nr:dynamin family protein [Actinoplanes regularis]GIE92158.1 hypothetical protein Are01nite_86380 [Actinoplanes regularis]SNT08537.1 Dynamin family protein [Actinoplanes regularis]